MEINIRDDVTVAGVVSEIISDDLIEIEIKNDWHCVIRKDDIKTLRPNRRGEIK